jgi:hypothetical protein
MEEAKGYALSNTDINDILQPDTNILTYPELRGHNRIDTIFDSLGRCILLYPLEAENNGHWVCLWKKDNVINYFDPYGLPIEEPKEWISQNRNVMMGQGFNYLTELLKKSGCEVYYNTFSYQKMDNDTATCGKWCVARLVCKDMTARQFYNTVMKFKKGSPDNFAIRFVYDYIGK